MNNIYASEESSYGIPEIDEKDLSEEVSELLDYCKKENISPEDIKVNDNPEQENFGIATKKGEPNISKFELKAQELSLEDKKTFLIFFLKLHEFSGAFAGVENISTANNTYTSGNETIEKALYHVSKQIFYILNGQRKAGPLEKNGTDISTMNLGGITENQQVNTLTSPQNILDVNSSILSYVADEDQEELRKGLLTFEEQFLSGETVMEEDEHGIGKEYIQLDSLDSSTYPSPLHELLPYFKKEDEVEIELIKGCKPNTPLEKYPHLTPKKNFSFVVKTPKGRAYLYGKDHDNFEQVHEQFLQFHRYNSTKSKWTTLKPPFQGFRINKNIIFNGKKHHTGDLISIQSDGETYPMRHNFFKNSCNYTHIPFIFYQATSNFRHPNTLKTIAYDIYLAHCDNNSITLTPETDDEMEVDLRLSMGPVFAVDTSGIICTGKKGSGKDISQRYLSSLLSGQQGTLSPKELMTFILCCHAAYESALTFQGFGTLKEKKYNPGLLNLGEEGLQLAWKSAAIAIPHMLRLVGEENQAKKLHVPQSLPKITISPEIKELLEQTARDKKTIQSIVGDHGGDMIKTAKKVAGIKGAILATSLLALDEIGDITTESFLQAIDKILKNRLSEEEDFIIRNAAHLTWQASQAPEDIERLKRAINMHSYLLEEPELKDEQEKDTQHVIKNLKLIKKLLDQKLHNAS